MKRQLIKAGFEPDQIPHDWLEVILAATGKWVQTTEEGVQHVGSLLHFEVEKGVPTNDYRVIDDVHHKIHEVPADDVLLFRGCLVKRTPIPLCHLEISERERTQCEDCGTMAHCTQVVRIPSADKLKTLCNHCTAFHENPRVYEQGDPQRCHACPVRACAHNPENLGRSYG